MRAPDQSIWARLIDGTDYPTPRDAAYTLPVTGTATYNGRAGGLYVASAGTDAPLPGALEIGEYEGRATLTADFGTMRNRRESRSSASRGRVD